MSLSWIGKIIISEMLCISEDVCPLCGGESAGGEIDMYGGKCEDCWSTGQSRFKAKSGSVNVINTGVGPKTYGGGKATGNDISDIRKLNLSEQPPKRKKGEKEFVGNVNAVYGTYGSGLSMNPVYKGDEDQFEMEKMIDAEKVERRLENRQRIAKPSSGLPDRSGKKWTIPAEKLAYYNERGIPGSTLLLYKRNGFDVSGVDWKKVKGNENWEKIITGSSSYSSYF